MKIKSILKYILNFVISYIASTAVLWLLSDNKGIEVVLIDGLIFTCLFKLIEFIGALLKNHNSKKDNSEENIAPESSNNEEAVVMWITGICLVLLLAFKLVLKFS